MPNHYHWLTSDVSGTPSPLDERDLQRLHDEGTVLGGGEATSQYELVLFDEDERVCYLNLHSPRVLDWI